MMCRRFVEKTKVYRADVLGTSSLLTTILEKEDVPTRQRSTGTLQTPARR